VENKETLITEYNSLREEIKNNSQVTAQIFTVTITATALLIGYATQTKNWIVFLSPFAVLIPSLWFISSQLESTIRIATYIKTFIEPKIEDLNWENKLFQLRRSGMMPERKYTLSITGIYGTIGLVCLVFSWVFMDYTTVNIIILSIVSPIVGGIMLFVALDVKKCFGLDFYLKYCKVWEELDNNRRL
jgi:predicted neutral ceramidase superfamily lipid hydrolase